MNPENAEQPPPPPEEIAIKLSKAITELGYSNSPDGRDLHLSGELDQITTNRLLQVIKHARLSSNAPDTVEDVPAIRILNADGNIIFRSQPIMAELMVEILNSPRISESVSNK